VRSLKLLLIGALLAAGLAGAALGLRCALRRIAAEYWRGQLRNIPEDRAERVLVQVAALGDPGLDVVVEALDSRREAVAEASLRVLLERLAAWQESPTAESCRLQVRLGRSLAERAGDFEPEGRRRAARLAARILLRLPLEMQEDRAGLIAECARVLRAAGPARSVPPPEPFTEELAASFPDGEPGGRTRHGGSSAETPGPSPMELGCRDPERWTPEPSVPVVVLPEPGIGDRAGVESGAARRLPLPPSDAAAKASPGEPLDAASPLYAASKGDFPKDIGITPPGTDEVMPPGGELPVLCDADGQDGEPSVAAPSPSPLPTAAHPHVEPSTAEHWSMVETVELMRRLQEPGSAESARAELVRRGFAPVQLELAERLFDPEPEARVQLVRLLPRLTSVDPAPWLWQLARDPEVQVRSEAIAALATGGHPSFLEKLERLAREDASPQIRGQADQIARIRENRLRQTAVRRGGPPRR